MKSGKRVGKVQSYDDIMSDDIVDSSTPQDHMQENVGVKQVTSQASPYRRWIAHAIGIVVVGAVFVVATYRDAVIATLPFGIGRGILDRALDDQLKKVFPNATSFSPKQTSPVPHFIAYTGAPGFRMVAGYVFWTTELEPLERGYDGPIEMLVGLDLNSAEIGWVFDRYRLARK